jgi:hypothetical protein
MSARIELATELARMLQPCRGRYLAVRIGRFSWRKSSNPSGFEPSRLCHANYSDANPTLLAAISVGDATGLQKFFNRRRLGIVDDLGGPGAS